MSDTSYIDDKKINDELNREVDLSSQHILEILDKAAELKGLDYHDVLTLLKLEDGELIQKLFDTARKAKETIYGNRLVLFAPLYISNLCNNECLYCAFRSTNKILVRKSLVQEEIANETKNLIDQGHKRLLLVAGEAYSKKGLDYVLESIDTVYKTTTDKGNIRRLNVNIAPLEVEEFKRLHEYNIGTYQLFQETYHRETYKKLHLKGPKANYDYRLDTIDRAFQGGFDDVGIGILFGLYDWRYEILALLSHIKHLEKTFGIGPHTISVPRLEPALNSDVSYNPPYPVSDRDFKKIIAVLRLAVPYTGIILSTRESREMRVDSFDLGVSQISAGSKTNPGGYDKKSSSEDTQKSEGMAQQFSLGDTRPLQEVIKDIVSAGYIPSFCTGCYRLGRVGKDFMDLAKPGLIKRHCLPNAIFSFAEYMENFSDQNLKTNGYDLIQRMMENDLPQGKFREKVQEMLNKTKSGEKDIYL